MVAAKRARTAALPEDLEKGVRVFYNGDCVGVVRDAFAPLDQFWIEDQTTGKLVRDDGGEIVQFRSSELALVPPPEKEPEKESVACCARVLLVGTEPQMLQILKQFGSPDSSQRHDPQQLIAIPCAECQCPSMLLKLATGGIESGMWELARKLRPDIKIELRADQLKQALEQMGPDIYQLQGHFFLSAVNLPYGLDEIRDAGCEVKRYWMEQVRCQIDLSVSAEGLKEEEGECDSLEPAAERALAVACGIRLSRALWAEETQLRVRKQLGIDVPLRFWEGNETKVFVIVLPQDAISSSVEGVLTFSAAPGAQAASRRQAPLQVSTTTMSREKSVADWQEHQEQFVGMHKLPAGWIRVKSRSSSDIYYFNTRTNESSFEMPLPPGWTKQKASGTGKTYYFHAKRKLSQYEPPEPEQ